MNTHYTKSVKSFLLSLLLCSNYIYAQDLISRGAEQEGIIVDTAVEWTTPSSSPQLYSEHQHTPLWHYKESTYFVWVDAALRPWVTKITSGQAQTTPLDPNPDYKVVNNSHNRFSLGIDKKGYLHIVGDMHNYTTATADANYPERYRRQSMLYWVSKQPESIAQGFEFAGGRNASTAVPATGFGYGRFFTDNNDDLYFSSRVKAIEGSHAPGEIGLGVYRYSPDTRTWIALGARAEDTRSGIYYNILLWENAGMAPNSWYQGFMTKLKFDRKNRLHLAAAINSDTTLSGNNRLVYAYSDNNGLNWNKFSQLRIAPLPIRVTDELTNQGDIIRRTQGPVFFDSKTDVIVDENGTTGVVNGSLYTWNGQDKWVNVERKFYLANTLNLNNKGHLILTSSGSAKMIRATSFSSKAYGYDFKGFNSYQSLDEYSLKKTGVLYGVGINTTEKKQSILKTTISKAPLPLEWRSKDVAATPVGYAGTAGFRNGEFIVNDYGLELSGAQDSFHYVYKTMRGDGIISAKVKLDGPSAHSRAGVMMRESLSFDSREISSLLLPNRKIALFDRRTERGNWAVNASVPINDQMTWVKLIRKGNQFTGYISVDGENWTQTGSVTMAMPESIYVGLASASTHRYNMQKTIYSSVISSPSEHTPPDNYFTKHK